MSSAVIVGSVLYLLFSCTVCLFLAGVIAVRELKGK